MTNDNCIKGTAIFPWPAKFLTFVLLFLISQSLAWAGQYRQTLEKPSVETFHAMLIYAKTEEYSKISQLIPYLGEIPMEIQNKFGVNLVQEIEMAVLKQDRQAMLTAIQKTIFYDTKDLFFLIGKKRRKSPAYLQSFLKSAYLNHVLLSPAVREKSPGAETRLLHLFEQAGRKFKVDTSPFAAEREGIDYAGLSNLLRDIEREYLQAFPEFSKMESSKP